MGGTHFGRHDKITSKQVLRTKSDLIAAVFLHGGIYVGIF